MIKRCCNLADEPQRNLQTILEELQAGLPGTTRPVYNWSERMEHREESWERIRPTLLECMISTYGLNDSVSTACTFNCGVSFCNHIFDI